MTSYGSERSYNGLRLARVARNTDVILFLMADAASCAETGQQVPKGFCNIELVARSVARKGKLLPCGTCMDARGLNDREPVEGAQRSTMTELADETLAAEKVLVF